MRVDEFLLARIAEDEQTAAWFSSGRRVIASTGVARIEHRLTLDQERLAAERRAKEKIVRAYQGFSEPHSLVDRVVFPSVQEAFRWAVVALAEVYSEHDDFDPAWVKRG